jgi:TRAP-type C4-dicarboxylate transport system permease small subunit
MFKIDSPILWFAISYIFLVIAVGSLGLIVFNLEQSIQQLQQQTR